MSKKLHIGAIQNELEGSAFFPTKKPPSLSPPPLPVGKEQTNTQPTSVPTTAATAQGVPPPVPRPIPLIPKVKRPMKQRQPFDIYADQYERLKKIAEAERG